jgi:hypothetical protein
MFPKPSWFSQQDAADLLALLDKKEHDPELSAALIVVTSVCKRIGDRLVEKE